MVWNLAVQAPENNIIFRDSNQPKKNLQHPWPSITGTACGTNFEKSFGQLHAGNSWTYRNKILCLVTGSHWHGSNLLISCKRTRMPCYQQLPVHSFQCLKRRIFEEGAYQENTVVTEFIAIFVAHVKLYILINGILGVPKYLDKPTNVTLFIVGSRDPFRWLLPDPSDPSDPSVYLCPYLISTINSLLYIYIYIYINIYTEHHYL